MIRNGCRLGLGPIRVGGVTQEKIMKRMLDHGRHSRDRREFSQEKRYSGSGFFAGLNTNIHKERSESRELNPKKFLSELAVLLVKPKVVDKQETKVPQHRYSLVS